MNLLDHLVFIDQSLKNALELQLISFNLKSSFVHSFDFFDTLRVGSEVLVGLGNELIDFLSIILK